MPEPFCFMERIFDVLKVALLIISICGLGELVHYLILRKHINDE